MRGGIGIPPGSQSEAVFKGGHGCKGLECVVFLEGPELHKRAHFKEWKLRFAPDSKLACPCVFWILNNSLD